MYQVSASFPRAERYGLTAQLRDAARSITANIAEGCGRSTDADFARFLHHSMGSACECLDHLITAFDEHYISAEQLRDFERRLGAIRGMLTTLLRRLKDD